MSKKVNKPEQGYFSRKIWQHVLATLAPSGIGSVVIVLIQLVSNVADFVQLLESELAIPYVVGIFLVVAGLNFIVFISQDANENTNQATSAKSRVQRRKQLEKQVNAYRNWAITAMVITILAVVGNVYLYSNKTQPYIDYQKLIVGIEDEFDKKQAKTEAELYRPELPQYGSKILVSETFENTEIGKIPNNYTQFTMESPPDSPNTTYYFGLKNIHVINDPENAQNNVIRIEGNENEEGGIGTVWEVNSIWENNSDELNYIFQARIKYLEMGNYNGSSVDLLSDGEWHVFQITDRGGLQTISYDGKIVSTEAWNFNNGDEIASSLSFLKVYPNSIVLVDDIIVWTE